METSPELFRRLTSPEVWAAEGERVANEEEIRIIGSLALADNIILGED